MSVKIDKGTALSALSLTPLIDVVFLLLIFFLVATRFAEEERELDIVLPEASEAKPLIEKPRSLFVNVTKQGQFFVEGKVLDDAALLAALRQAWANNPGRAEVVIRADKDSKTRHIVTVMNLCNKAKIRNNKIAIDE